MKRIICCLDGTWNSAISGVPKTNVWKLAEAIAAKDAAGIVQITRYIEGIASRLGETAQFLKGAVGFGVEERIESAYGALAKDYEAGDEIFLFGFSRGAYEARSLGAFITQFGIAKSDASGSLPRLGRSTASGNRNALPMPSGRSAQVGTTRSASNAWASGIPSVILETPSFQV